MRKLSVAAALFAAIQASAGWSQTAPEERRIIVDGYAEVKTMPDVATFSYTLRGEGSTSDDAVKAMVAMGKTIHAMLFTVDKAVEPKTSDVKVAPVKDSACKERQYDDNQLSKGVCAIVGYIATQDVTVRTTDINDVGTMIGLVGRGGAYDAELGRFELSNVEAVRRQALALAIADAQAKAVAVADGSHVKLGPIVTLSTSGRVDAPQEVKLAGTTRTEDLINSLPQSFAKPIAVTVVPEPITTSANVSIAYQILP